MSLLEIMLAFLILFLVSLYCMSMFAQGQRHWVRAQEYSACAFLVNTKMQGLLAMPFLEMKQSLPAPSASPAPRFDLPFSDYTYAVSLSALDPVNDALTYVLRVEVDSRKGASAHAVTLVSDEQRFLGVSVDPATSRVDFALGSSTGPALSTLGWLFDNGASPYTVTSTSADPGANPVGAVSGHAGSNEVWTTSFQQGVVPYKETLGTWGASVAAFQASPVPSPVPAGLTAPRYTGSATDTFTNRVFVADGANRCLWVLDASGATPAWLNGAPNPATPMRPTTTPLGAPAGVATDAWGSLVWVADRENQCLRKLLITSTAPASPLNPVEPDPTGIGYWDKMQYRPPAAIGMLGSPQGLVVDPQGYAVYLLDRDHLWQFVDSTGPNGTWRIVLDFQRDGYQGLEMAGPSGLAFDPYGNVFYINCLQGQLWKCKPGTPPSYQRIW